MRDIENLLINIKKNPEVYIGSPSLKKLSAFLSGYVFRQQQEDNSELPTFYIQFQEYIQDFYQIKSSHGWRQIISFYSETDEEAFTKFYEHLEQFFIKNNKR